MVRSNCVKFLDSFIKPAYSALYNNLSCRIEKTFRPLSWHLQAVDFLSFSFSSPQTTDKCSFYCSMCNLSNCYAVARLPIWYGCEKKHNDRSLFTSIFVTFSRGGHGTILKEPKNCCFCAKAFVNTLKRTHILKDIYKSGSNLKIHGQCY
jgi:hypothetical protein